MLVEEGVIGTEVMVNIGGVFRVTEMAEHGVHNTMGLDNKLKEVVVFVGILAIRHGNVKRIGYVITVVSEDTLGESVGT